MKRIILSCLVFLLCICMISCGEQSVNAQVSNKINKNIDHLSSTIKEVESINENDILITEIMPADSTTYTAIINPRRGINSTRQIVEYNGNQNIGYSQTDAMKNINTYNAYGKNHNVNSFTGYGEVNPLAYNEINQAQYGGAYPNSYQNGLGYGINHGYAAPYNGGLGGAYRGISNVNTYGLGVSNVNTYNPNNVVTEQNQKDTTAQQQQRQGNINSYKATDDNYEQYETDKNLQNQFTKLSALYSVASNVFSVNRAINDEKIYILSTASEIKELANELEQKEVELSESEKNSILSLLENIQSNLTKINLSKNEVRYEVDKIKSLKNNYQNLTEQLSSRYIRLANCLETRYSYYCNISSCLDQLKSVMSLQNNLTSENNLTEQDITSIKQQNQNQTLTEQTLPEQNDNIVNQSEKIDNGVENQQVKTDKTIYKQNSVNEKAQNNQTVDNINNNNNNNNNDNKQIQNTIPTAPTNNQNKSLQERLTAEFEKQYQKSNSPDKKSVLTQENQNQTNTNQIKQNQTEDENIDTNDNKIEHKNSLQTNLDKEIQKQKLNDSSSNADNQNNQTTTKQQSAKQPRRPVNLYEQKYRINKNEEQSQITFFMPFKEPKKYDFLSFSCPPKQDLLPLTQEEIELSRPK